MRSFYLILVFIILAFMFCGLYYVRMEMNTPGHPDRLERAEAALNPSRSSSAPPVRVAVVRSEEPAKPAPTPPPPAPKPEPEKTQPIEPPAPNVDTTYRLIDRVYNAPKQVQTEELDFFGKKVVKTIPGSLLLQFKGVSTNTEYPAIEAKVAMADLFIVGAIYTREQINNAKINPKK
jgi:hypothetical protein